jgi:ribosomal protein S18 acetylase RimI-like enzyme
MYWLAPSSTRRRVCAKLGVVDHDHQSEPVRLRRLGVGDVDLLMPLWAEMHRHHMSVAEHMYSVALPLPIEQAWTNRRRLYVQWLSSSEGAAWLAERDDRAVGYAMARVMDDPPRSWGIGPRIGVLETLSVVPSERGHGVGSQLLDAAKHELTAMGAKQFRLNVISTNAGAIRFYQRHGMQPFVTMMVGLADAAVDDDAGLAHSSNLGA